MTTRRQKLASRRRALGFSQESLSEAVGVSPTTVARWEQGTSLPKAIIRGPLAEKLQVTMPELERMLTSEPPAALNGHAVPAWLDHYTSLEQGAARIQTVEPVTVPGLLQTEDYAAAMLRQHYQPVSEQDVADRTESRMTRQAVLDRRPDPLELHCIIDESALNRETGSAGVMAAQMDHLLAMDAKPTVLVQIVPADGPALHTAWFGSFTLFTSAGSSTPFMTCTENLGGVHYQDSPHVIEAHAELFAHLAAVALTPEQSAELIKNRAERYR
jgi:transcriptional regulator with XRE-family HTH domain